MTEPDLNMTNPTLSAAPLPPGGGEGEEGVFSTRQSWGGSLMDRRPSPHPPEVRFGSRLVHDRDTGCINWTGASNGRGYGRFRVAGKLILAHRFAYEHARGPIPEGLVIDHLCRNTRCCNAEHLEAVTSRVNTARGLSGARDAAKTHCPRGHPYDAANTYRSPRGHRCCRICKREQSNRASRKRRARDTLAAIKGGAEPVQDLHELDSPSRSQPSGRVTEGESSAATDTSTSMERNEP